VVEKCLQTRSQSKGRQQGISDNTPGPSGSAQSNNNSVTDQATAINRVTMVSMERRLFSLLSEKITDLIQNSVEESVQRLIRTPPNSAISGEERSATPPPVDEENNEPAFVEQIQNRHRVLPNIGSPGSHRNVISDLLTIFYFKPMEN